MTDRSGRKGHEARRCGGAGSTARDERRDSGLVVFQIVSRASACAECGRDLERGDLLRKEGDAGLCLACADLEHLEFLGAGNAALTRRATKHSTLHAVVVRWSRARKRYERQGVLVEPEAVERAEAECLADDEARRLRRDREAERRESRDSDYVAEFARRIRAQYPNCPGGEEERIAGHACRKLSGRVGRSAAAKEFDPEAI